MRLLDLLTTSTGYLQKHGVESPRLTMELMLAEVLGKTRLQLYLCFEEEVPETTLARLRPMVKRRSEGEPLEHILGFKEFDGLRFAVSPSVLIPRPETELLVQAASERIELGGGPIVDVGAGSGAIAISLAKRFPSLQAVALDISVEALDVARANAAALGAANVELISSDLLAGWRGTAQMIVANLPYLPTPWYEKLPREVRREPRLALDGGTDGLDLLRRLVPESRTRTRWLILECAEGQAEALKSLCQTNHYEVTNVLRDFANVERVIIAQSQSR
jgi:release factor glutamine methyltransferase